MIKRIIIWNLLVVSMLMGASGFAMVQETPAQRELREANAAWEDANTAWKALVEKLTNNSKADFDVVTLDENKSSAINNALNAFIKQAGDYRQAIEVYLKPGYPINELFLRSAVQARCDVDLIKELLKLGVTLYNPLDKETQSIEFRIVAGMNGSQDKEYLLDVLKTLLAAKEEADAKSKTEDAVRTGGDPGSRTEKNTYRYLIDIAASSGNIDVVDLLLEKIKDPNKYDIYWKKSIAMLNNLIKAYVEQPDRVIKEKIFEATKKLLDNGLDIPSHGLDDLKELVVKAKDLALYQLVGEKLGMKKQEAGLRKEIAEQEQRLKQEQEKQKSLITKTLLQELYNNSDIKPDVYVVEDAKKTIIKKALDKLIAEPKDYDIDGVVELKSGVPPYERQENKKWVYDLILRSAIQAEYPIEGITSLFDKKIVPVDTIVSKLETLDMMGIKSYLEKTANGIQPVLFRLIPGSDTEQSYCFQVFKMLLSISQLSVANFEYQYHLLLECAVQHDNLPMVQMLINRDDYKSTSLFYIHKHVLDHYRKSKDKSKSLAVIEALLASKNVYSGQGHKSSTESEVAKINDPALSALFRKYGFDIKADSKVTAALADLKASLLKSNQAMITLREKLGRVIRVH